MSGYSHDEIRADTSRGQLVYGINTPPPQSRFCVIVRHSEEKVQPGAQLESKLNTSWSNRIRLISWSKWLPQI